MSEMSKECSYHLRRIKRHHIPELHMVVLPYSHEKVMPTITSKVLISWHNVDSEQSMFLSFEKDVSCHAISVANERNTECQVHPAIPTEGDKIILHASFSSLFSG